MKDSIEEKSTLYIKKKLRHQEMNRPLKTNFFKKLAIKIVIHLTIFFRWSEPSVLLVDLN